MEKHQLTTGAFSVYARVHVSEPNESSPFFYKDEVKGIVEKVGQSWE
jgi:hypothetical protein